ncbi:MAG: hypothetical protein F4Y03_13200 [Alphaproteobacteria bacterium]|nr:hypothetical protein [Alphaproteobacteria bacterium]
MTATDPRPRLPRTPIRGLAATLAARLAPAAEALALAYAEDIAAGPPPEDDRALAERDRAGRAQLSHLRQLLAVLDWAAARLPEPEPAPVEEPADGFHNPFDEPGPVESGYDGSEERPGFREWSEEMERRFGPVPMDEGGEGGPVECHAGGRTFVGRLPPPEFGAWRERRHRRTEAPIARRLARARNAGPDRRRAMPTTPPHDKT